MTRMRLRLFALLATVILLTFVVWQNLQPAAFGVWQWRLEAPLAVWVVATFALGLGTGWMICRLRS